jgi:hypothetical protein
MGTRILKSKSFVWKSESKSRLCKEQAKDILNHELFSLDKPESKSHLYQKWAEGVAAAASKSLGAQGRNEPFTLPSAPRREAPSEDSLGRKA